MNAETPERGSFSAPRTSFVPPVYPRVDYEDYCEHFVEREACVMCAPRYQGEDIRDGKCPQHDGFTWHVVNADGSSECCACGDIHPYVAGGLSGGDRA